MQGNLKDTIVAISTPAGEGGIGIVRMSGKKALSIADTLFVSKKGIRPSDFKTYTMNYGHVIHALPKTNKTPDKKRKAKQGTLEVIDEVILSVMKAPMSYTKEDVVEINCHGGIVPMRKIMEEIVKQGVRPAEPGEFTKRAFLNGRIDLAQAEAVCDVITAKTDTSLKVALSHLDGNFSKEISKQRDMLLDVLKDIEAEIDFSEDIESVRLDKIISRLESARVMLKELSQTQDLGMILKDGISCVICGKPNVGKSSLLNVLLRRNRAIVTHIPGTTRDVIEEAVNIKGLLVKLADTAGIVRSKNIVEQKGVNLTKEYIERADLVILVLDLSRPFDKKDKEVMALVPVEKMIVAANKSDLKQKWKVAKIKSFESKKIVKISALKKKNINLIEDEIANKIWSGKVIHPESVFVTNVRHKRALGIALKNLNSALSGVKKGLPLEVVAVDVRGSILQLGSITGESVDIDILDRIFENFCIGK